MAEHLGYDRHDPAGRGRGGSRNGIRTRTVLTEVGPVNIDVPRTPTPRSNRRSSRSANAG
jgi:transposase-like protein